MGQSSKHHKPGKDGKISLRDFVMTSLSPLILGKSIILYCGIKYSEEPGEGYGYGLAFGFTLTAFTFARFIYKYRNYVD